MLGAAAILLITQGARQSLGLFVAPLDRDTGLGIASVSFAFAVSQFMWGFAQPFFGALATRWGTRRVLVSGALLVALGTALTPFARTSATLTLSLGIIAAVGAAAGSFAILIGGIARYLPEERRAFAAGFINAGASIGQFVFAPVLQWGIDAYGWVPTMFGLAATALLAIPLSLRLTADLASAPVAAGAGTGQRLGEQLRRALGERSYLLLHLGFFTCGFHVAFLITHLPGQVALCGLAPAVSAAALALIGLFNIAGSLAAGELSQRWKRRELLVAIYAARGVVMGGFMLLPKTTETVLVFSALMGILWLSTVPPTVALVARNFGTRWLATMFGLVFLGHQIGGFTGAWLGGLIFDRTGSYDLMWIIGILAAVFAALIHMPVKDPAPAPKPATA